MLNEIVWDGENGRFVLAKDKRTIVEPKPLGSPRVFFDWNKSSGGNVEISAIISKNAPDVADAYSKGQIIDDKYFAVQFYKI
jgi:hypothetical protein